MKKYSYIILIFNFLSLVSKPIVISLGENCAPAAALRTLFNRYYGLRDKAFPFDWIVTSFEGLYKCIQEDFENFLNEKYLIKHPIHPQTGGVINIYYDFQFNHDFPTTHNINPPEEDPSFAGEVRDDFKQLIQPVKEKYFRRIQRFYEACKGQTPVVFIRRRATKGQAEKLYALLQKKFPDIEFTLVIVDSYEEIKNDWGLSNIKNFYIPDYYDRTMYGIDSEEWKSMLQAVGIL
ncbi:MAG: papain-like cysteine peptidase [Candidatus Babeliaceae bacterium]|nr:papain-like cysteine peptidase [Candidatus Babeliaceae bacterium]